MTVLAPRTTVRLARKDEVGCAAQLLTPHDRRRLFVDLYAEEPSAHVLVATQADEVVGTVVGNQQGPVGWIGHLVVAPAAQGQGIGSALVEACAAQLEAEGCVGLVTTAASPASRALFCRHGFSDAGRYVFRQGHFPVGTRRPVRSLTADDAAAVLDLDQEATGADRSHLIRRWLLDGVGVFDDDGQLDGFHVPFPYGAPGAGPVIARDPAAAACLLAPAPGGTHLVCLHDNEAEQHAWQRRRFVATAVAPRLARGVFGTHQSTWIYGIHSLALG